MAGIVLKRENVKVETKKTEYYESIEMRGTEKGLFLRRPLKKIEFQEMWMENQNRIYTPIQKRFKTQYAVCMRFVLVMVQLSRNLMNG